jgi:hypothetical protein
MALASGIHWVSVCAAMTDGFTYGRSSEPAAYTKLNGFGPRIGLT